MTPAHPSSHPKSTQPRTHAIEAWLAKTRPGQTFSIETLAGDGSPRRFCRLHGSGPDSPSWILVDDPDWILSKDYPAHQAWLNSKRLPVPEFYEIDEGQGLLVMQDLGDELLQARFTAQPETRREWLNGAVDLLADLHTRTFPVPASLPVASRAFDQAKFSQEWEHTQKYLLHGYLKVAPSSANAALPFYQKLETIQPRAFSHRDYHARNLIVHQERLWLIDFQDARMGPPHYDLASLLYDPYVEVASAERDALRDRYRTRVQSTDLGKAIDWKLFERDIRLFAFQRVIKAAGSFASFFLAHGKTTHLKYISPALLTAKQLQAIEPMLSTTEMLALFPISDWLEKMPE